MDLRHSIPLLVLCLAGLAHSQPWIKYKGSEYKYYGASSDKVTWKVAENVCVSQCAHTVSIGSAAEQKFISALLPTSDIIWLGGTRSSVGNDFTWVDGLSPFSAFSSWDVGEPVCIFFPL